METHIYLSAFIAIAVFCICNKWTTLSKNVCMFCTIGWASIAICIVQIGLAMFNFGDISIDIIRTAIIEVFKNIFFIWASSSIFYFFLKHNFE